MVIRGRARVAPDSGRLATPRLPPRTPKSLFCPRGFFQGFHGFNRPVSTSTGTICAIFSPAFNSTAHCPDSSSPPGSRRDSRHRSRRQSLQARARPCWSGRAPAGPAARRSQDAALPRRCRCAAAPFRAAPERHRIQRKNVVAQILAGMGHHRRLGAGFQQFHAQHDFDASGHADLTDEGP